MAADEKGANEAPAKIFHTPCAFNPIGVSKDVCMSITGVISQNAGCCAINCTSSARACKACLLQNGVPLRVSDPGSGLCAFHVENGPGATRPAEISDRDFLYSKMPSMRISKDDEEDDESEPVPKARRNREPRVLVKVGTGPKKVTTPSAPAPETKPIVANTKKKTQAPRVLGQVSQADLVTAVRKKDNTAGIMLNCFLKGWVSRTSITLEQEQVIWEVAKEIGVTSPFKK